MNYISLIIYGIALTAISTLYFYLIRRMYNLYTSYINKTTEILNGTNKILISTKEKLNQIDAMFSALSKVAEELKEKKGENA
jgi:hypothetical protein